MSKPRTTKYVIIVLAVAVMAPALGAAYAVGATPSFNAKAFDDAGSRSKSRLQKAVVAFDANITSMTPAEQQAWRQYVEWNTWGQPLLESKTWNVPAMKLIAKRLYAAEHGFEHPTIVELRTALTNYLNFEEAVAEAGGDVPGEFVHRVDRLQQAAQTGGADYAALEDAAWWLATTGQASELLAQLRRQFNGPAIVGQVHREMIEAKLGAFAKNSAESRRTRNRIQGASVVGTAHVQSQTNAQLFDAPTDARLRIVTTGRVSSPNNVATSGNVRVSSSGNASFSGVADVYWDGTRFTMTAPQVTADMQTRIKSIQSPWIGRRIAARRVYGGRSAAQAEGEALVEREATQSMSEQLAIGVEKINKKAEGFLNLLTRTGITAQRWDSRVRDNHVEIGYLPPTAAGISAPPHTVPPLAGEEGIGLSFHDSAIESILHPQVAGAKWKDVQFATLQHELTGGNSDELMIGVHPGRWSAQWSWRLPVRIHFTPEGATVRYRFSSIEIDTEVQNIPIEVRADLRVEVTSVGLGFRLRSPVTVATLSDQQLPPHFGPFLERKFGALFGKRFYLDGLQFPAGGHLDPMSGYRPVAAHLEPNWVHLRYSNRTAKPELVVLEKE